MMPLNPQQRRLMLKYIPQLTKADLNKYESLVAFAAQQKYKSGMIPPIRKEKTERHIDNPVQEIYNEALAIFAPVQKQYQKVNLQT